MLCGNNDNATQLLVYVAGPYRDARGEYYVHQNCKAAEDVAATLWGWGYSVICPHKNTRHFDGLVSTDVLLSGDMTQIGKCDLVVFLPGWERSEGATKELEFVTARRIPRVFWKLGVTEDAFKRMVKWSILSQMQPI